MISKRKLGQDSNGRKIVLIQDTKSGEWKIIRSSNQNKWQIISNYGSHGISVITSTVGRCEISSVGFKSRCCTVWTADLTASMQ